MILDVKEFSSAASRVIGQPDGKDGRSFSLRNLMEQDASQQD